VSGVYNVRGVSLTEKQATLLLSLIKGPMLIEGANGYDRRTLAILGDAELVKSNDVRAEITDEGRKVVIELNAKVNGTPAPEPAPAPRETKPRKIKAKGRRQPAAKAAAAAKRNSRDSRERPAARRESPPPTGVVDFEALRARIVEHYEADLAACDRMREIAAKVGA
jgi:hypothetical protein